MSLCQTEIIYESEGFVLTRCVDCGRLGMLFGQGMLCFDQANFEAFMNYMDKMIFEADKMQFYDDRDRVMIETYHPDVHFCLVEEEFYRLKAALAEVKLQLNILDLIRQF